MKKSDKKQYDKAWMGYYESTKELIDNLDIMLNLNDKELSVDEVNQLSARIYKLASTIRRIVEAHNMR